MGSEFSDRLPLCLNVLAEGRQALVKPLVLVELALLVLAEVSQELGQLACLSVEPLEAARTAAEGFINSGQPPGDLGDLLGQGRPDSIVQPSSRPVDNTASYPQTGHLALGRTVRRTAR